MLFHVAGRVVGKDRLAFLMLLVDYAIVRMIKFQAFLLQKAESKMMKLIKKYFDKPKETRYRHVKMFIFKKIFANKVFRIFNNYKSVLYLTYRPDFDWRFNKFNNSKQLHNVWTNADEMGLKSGDLIRLYFLYSNLEYCLSINIPGSLAELGVYRGNSAKIMHLLAPDRKLYLFDTFEGYDKKDLQKEPYDYDKTLEKAFTNTSLEHVKNFIGENNVVYCKGYFPDTTKCIPENEIFAFVHIDVDLYIPAKNGLEYFYPRMAKGGIIVIHDYNSWLPGVTKAVDEFFLDKPENPVLIPDASGSAAVSMNK